MLDIKFLRENPDIVKQNIKNKFQDSKLPMVDEVIELDAKKRDCQQEADSLRANRNKISKQIGALMAQGKKEEAEEVKKEVAASAARLSELEEQEKELDEKILKIMMVIPNIIDPSVPIGKDDSENVEIEKFDERYGIRPDAEGIMDNGERILIEFYVSHKVDQKKRQIIVDNNLKCIEIDIKYQALNKVELKKFLTNTDKGRKWIQATPQSPKSKSSSNSSKRDPMYEKTRDIIKIYLITALSSFIRMVLTSHLICDNLDMMFAKLTRDFEVLNQTCYYIEARKKMVTYL